MNRAQRRAAAKANRLPKWLPPGKEERVRRLMQNGISPDDLQKEFQSGYEEGFKNASKPIIRSCYAAVCLALRELYRFGSKRCCDVLSVMDRKLLETLTSEDAINEVWKQIGLQINFGEPFDRIERLDKREKPIKEV